MSGEIRLTAKEICAIIKAGDSANLESLTVGPLSICFRKKSEEPQNAITNGTLYVPGHGAAIVSNLAVTDPPVGQANDSNDLDDYRFQLALTDHVAWEAAELEDKKDAQEA